MKFCFSFLNRNDKVYSSINYPENSKKYVKKEESKTKYDRKIPFYVVISVGGITRNLGFYLSIVVGKDRKSDVKHTQNPFPVTDI